MQTTPNRAAGRLCACSDDALAHAAAAGDQAAFGELASRYRNVIAWASRRPVAGTTSEDLGQAALIGLFEACRAHDPRRGAFRPLAAACMANHAREENRQAAKPKHRLLSLAVGLDQRDEDGESLTLAERLPAHDGVDPARIIEAREQLASIAAALPALTPRLRAALTAEGGEAIKPRWHARRRLRELMEHAPEPPKTRAQPRTYTRAQIARAIGLVQAGASVGHAAFMVGADKSTVSGWLVDAA